MNLVGIKSALAAGLRDAMPDGVRVHRAPPPKTEMPCLVLSWPERIEYNRSFAQGSTVEIGLTLLVAQTETEYAHYQLESAVSLVDCSDDIEALTGQPLAAPPVPAIAPIVKGIASELWESAYVTEATSFGTYTTGANEGFGCVFSIVVDAVGVPKS